MTGWTLEEAEVAARDHKIWGIFYVRQQVHRCMMLFDDDDDDTCINFIPVQEWIWCHNASPPLCTPVFQLCCS